MSWDVSIPPELKTELQAFAEFLLEWDVEMSTDASYDAHTLKQLALQAGTVDEDDLAMICLQRNWTHLKQAWNVELFLPQRVKTR